MKKLISVMAMSMLLSVASNAEPKPVSRNEEQQAEAVRQERQMYQGQIQAKLRDLDRQIEALKAKAAKESKVDRKQLEKDLAELDRKRAVAQRQLEKLETSSQQAWVDMKAGLDAAMHDLEAAYQRAASHFK